MSARRPHPYDENFEPTVAPWLTFVPIAESRAITKPIYPDLLHTLLERCKER